jgi:hypothetical protein
MLACSGEQANVERGHVDLLAVLITAVVLVFVIVQLFNSE